MLSKLASTKALGNNWSVILETLNSPTIDLEVHAVEADPNFLRVPIIRFLKEKALPDSLKEAKKLRRTTSLYTMIGDQLYKKNFTMLFFKCVDRRQVAYMMDEVHEGVYGSHNGG